MKECWVDIKNRMTNYCRNDCRVCLLGRLNNGKGIDCQTFENLYEKETKYIVRKWGEEHPTIIYKFFEVFPDAPKEDDGTPKKVCPMDIGYIREELECFRCTPENCRECWSQLYIKENNRIRN